LRYATLPPFGSADNQDPESVKKCLDDPTNSKCTFRSALRASITTIDLEVTALPAHIIQKTIYIRIVGPRHDERSRSASPRRRDAATDAQHTRDDSPRPYSRDRLPAKLSIYACPQWNSSRTRVVHFAVIPPTHVPLERWLNDVRRNTHKQPRLLGEIDMRHGVPEKDVSTLRTVVI
jgi:hypothetical protein